MSSPPGGHGALIEWQDVSVTVLDRATGQHKRILTDMSGLAQPGRLLSIMGPSGAGKSTLLDVLACNSGSANSSSSGTSMEGRVLVDGAPRSVRQFRRISAYVQQQDILLSSATVREVLQTTAMLKLPLSVTRAQKIELVEATLTELDLTACADTLIGDETIGLKGISGGQKRRVSVGIELIKDPRVLFLDEPSSGLDSEMALSVMNSLVRLARKGRTVVCTIHQPNSDITDCFDDFLLLAGGRAVYGGLWSGAVGFFANAGFSCPSFKNPTDYFMSVVTRDEAAVEALAATYAQSRSVLLQQMVGEGGRSGADGGGKGQEEGPRGSQGAHVAVCVEGAAEGTLRSKATVSSIGGGGGELQEEKVVEHAEVPWWYQTAVLSVRYWRSWVRNPVLMISELVQYLFLGVFLGLMYYRFNDTLGQGDFNRSSCVFFSFAILCFTPSYTAVTNWASERLLLKRELDQRMYGITSYYLARYSVILPFEILQCGLFLAIMYFFVGFYPSASNFFTFFAVFGMFQVISEGVGACCAVATNTSTNGIVLVTLLLLLLLSFSGFLTVKIPIYFVWLQKTTYFSYAYAALLELEFSAISFRDPATGKVLPGMEAYPPQLRTGLTYAQNIGVLTAQFGGMEAIKLAVFHLAYRRNMM